MIQVYLHFKEAKKSWISVIILAQEIWSVEDPRDLTHIDRLIAPAHLIQDLSQPLVLEMMPLNTTS